MELEFHQLDLRYERLRVRQPARERRLLASLAEAGQQMPIVVVTAGAALRRRGRPQTRPLPAPAAARHGGRRRSGRWPEAEALIFRQLLHTDATDSALEQGWLLRTLHEDHGLALERAGAALRSQRELGVAAPEPGAHAARRRSSSTCSDGQLVAHAAMKYLRAVGARQRGRLRPPRRGDRAASAHARDRSAGSIRSTSPGPTPRASWCSTDPLLVLRVTDDTPRAAVRPDASAPEALITDLHILGAVARRAASPPAARGRPAAAGARARLARSSIRSRRTFTICNAGVRRSCAMLDQGLRTAILSLQAKGHGIRQIARALQISRGTVRTVLKAGSPTVPRIDRAEKAEPYRDQILEWVERCRGNLVRVHEELVAQGVDDLLSRADGLLPAPWDRPRAAGARGPLRLRARRRRCSTTPRPTAPRSAASSSASRPPRSCCATRGMLFFQAYPVFTRFYCKVFLTDALEYLGGAAATCMIDNTHVVVASGTGARMVPGARDGGLRRALRLRLPGA